jgi:hypothetical protein
MGSSGELDPDIVARIAAKEAKGIRSCTSYRLIAVVTALSLGFATRGALLTFDQDFEFTTEVALNEGSLGFTARGGEFAAARLLLGIRYLISPIRSRRIRPRRVAEEMCACVADSPHDMQRALERRPILARETDHNIACDGEVGNLGVCGATPVEIELLIVRTVHTGQHAAIAALQGNMQMPAEPGLCCERRQQLVGDLRRLDRGEPHPLDARNLRETQQQICQVRRVRIRLVVKRS